MTDSESKLYELIVKRIEDIGIARQMISTLLEDEIWKKLSKHDSYWDSEHSIEGDKLDIIRFKLVSIEQSIFDIKMVLCSDNQENN